MKLIAVIRTLLALPARVSRLESAYESLQQQLIELREIRAAVTQQRTRRLGERLDALEQHAEDGLVYVSIDGGRMIEWSMSQTDAVFAMTRRQAVALGVPISQTNTAIVGIRSVPGDDS